MKSDNAIVDEVRAARKAIARKSGDDLGKIVEAARARQAKGSRNVVSRSQKKAGSAKRAS
ncbi:MAG: hypothetical protein IPL75_09900 [Acidobacteria bacterium]|nr:hypothetical protein [Acidobacteriota bacterium]